MKVTSIKSGSTASDSQTRNKIRISTLQEKKARREPISSLSLADFTSARLADEAGIDFVLVGDSLGSYFLGYDNTLPVSLEELLHPQTAGKRGGA